MVAVKKLAVFPAVSLSLSLSLINALIRVVRDLLHLWSGVGPTCRFEPTCSQFSRVALRERGLWVGGYYAMRRILRCHPWSHGGIDNSIGGGLR